LILQKFFTDFSGKMIKFAPDFFRYDSGKIRYSLFIDIIY